MREYLGNGVTADVATDGSLTIQDDIRYEETVYISLDRASVEALLKLIEKGKLK